MVYWRENPKHAEALKIYKNRYAQTHKEQRKEYTKQYRKDNKRKGQVHKIIRNRIISGKLKRPKICPVCHRTGLVVAHHDDYSKPLIIEWMCVSCHLLLHRNIA